MATAKPKAKGKGKVKPEEDKGVAKNERALKGGYRTVQVDNIGKPGKNADPEAQNKDGQEGRPNQEAQQEVDLPVTDRLPFNIFVLATTFLNILIIGLEQAVPYPSTAGRADFEHKLCNTHTFLGEPEKLFNNYRYA